MPFKFVVRNDSTGGDYLDKPTGYCEAPFKDAHRFENIEDVDANSNDHPAK